MEAIVQSQSIMKIKNIEHEHLEDSSHFEASTSKWTPPAWHSWSPHQPQVNACIDEARAEAQYESTVILSSGYGRSKPYSVDKNVLQDTPNNFLRLPAEVRNRIYAYALPHGRVIGSCNGGRPYIRRSGTNEARHSSKVVPHLLQTCRQIREEASAMYYSKQSFLFENDFPYLGLQNRTTLMAWLNSLKAVTGLMSSLEIHIRSRGCQVLFTLKGKEYSFEGRLRDEEGDVAEIMEEIRRIKACVEAAVGETDLGPSSDPPTISIRGFLSRRLESKGRTLERWRDLSQGEEEVGS